LHDNDTSILTFAARAKVPAKSVFANDPKMATLLPSLKVKIAAEPTVQTGKAMQYVNLRDHYSDYASVNIGAEEHMCAAK
jgi:hypothetical protein